MARDLQLKAVLVDKVSASLAKAAQDWKKVVEEPAKAAIKEQEKNNKRIVDNDEKLARERIRLQRASISLMEKQSAEAASVSMRAGENTLRESRSQAAAALKIQRQAAIAESALVLNKFDRMMAKEKQIHSHRLTDLKENDAAIEAEMRRHNAVIGRMSMDKANFPNTPFQQLLGSLTKVTGQMGIAMPAAINTMQSSMSGATALSGRMAFGMVAVGAAATGMAAGLALSYKEARESIDADKRLDLTLRSTGRGAEFTTRELAKLADQYQETTDYTDENVKAAQTILLRYDAIGRDTFPKALKAAADLGAETGDLAGAAFNLGTALQAPEEAGRKLTSMGIKLTDTEKKILQQFADTGDTIKAQEFILDKVAKAYGGSSQTMSHDTVKLGHALGELAEQIGGPLVRAADAAAAAISGMIKSSSGKATSDFYQAQIKGIQDYTTEAGKVVVVDRARAAAQKKDIEDAQKQERQKTAGPNVDQINAMAKEKEADIAAKAEARERAKADREEDLRSATEIATKQAVAKQNAIYKENKYIRDLQEKEKAADKADDDKRMALEKERATAKDSLRMAKAGGDPMALLAIKHEQELALVADHQSKLDTIERQDIERKEEIAAREKQIAEAKAGYYAGYAQSVSQMIGVIGGKSKVAFAMQKSIALGEIGVRTAAAVVQSNSNPLTMWKVPYDIALGASQAAVVAATALKGFESGGWTGGGRRDEVAGVVHGGEMVWSQADVRRAGGRQQAEQIRQGNNTTSVSAPINIVINGNADARVVKAIGETIEQKLRNHAWMNKEIQYRGITA